MGFPILFTANTFSFISHCMSFLNHNYSNEYGKAHPIEPSYNRIEYRFQSFQINIIVYCHILQHTHSNMLPGIWSFIMMIIMFKLGKREHFTKVSITYMVVGIIVLQLLQYKLVFNVLGICRNSYDRIKPVFLGTSVIPAYNIILIIIQPYITFG